MRIKIGEIMVFTPRLEIKGLEKVFNGLEKAKTKILTEAHKRMYILTSSAAGAARTSMPGWIWDTGNLASSIDNLVRWEFSHLAGYVFTPVEYGIYVHFGTKKMRARPFMDVAINFIATKAINVFRGLV